MEDNVITWKPCYKVGGLVVYVTRYGDVITIDSRGRLTYKKQKTQHSSPALLNHRKNTRPSRYQMIYICTDHSTGLHVHRLVASVYCQCPDLSRMEVDHLDGDPTNNRWDNLEWVTHSENVRRFYEKKKLLADSNR